MRRLAVLVSVIALVLLGLVLTDRAHTTTAQDATPPSDEEFAGVSFAPIAFGTTTELPAAPADLILIRVTLEPGAVLPGSVEDPEAVLISVESGTLTLRAEEPVTVFRAATIAAFATPFAIEQVPPEEVAAGTEFTLSQGDSFLYPPNVAGELRNDGTEPVVALVALVAPAETDEDGTPAAGTPAA